MNKLARLRFTGEEPVTFHHPGVGYTEPGGEFTVPEEDAERFTRRADVERVDGGSGASEDSSASQDADTSGGGLPRSRAGRKNSTE